MLLFITRKYPPNIGGMETYAAALFKYLTLEKKLVAPKKKLKKNILGFVWFNLLSLFEALKTNDSKIIFLADGSLALLGRILKIITKKKIVIAVHGLDVLFSNYLYQKIIVRSLKKIDAIVAVSQNTKNICLQKNIPTGIITVIPNGVEVNNSRKNFPREKYFLTSLLKIKLNEKKVLITVGRLVGRKGVLWFIKNVAPKLPKSSVYIVIGDGPLRNEVFQTIEILKLRNKVFLLTNLNSEELKKIYEEADLFIMPNISQKNDVEGFGIVALEAASYGLPVIAAGVDGVKNVLGNNFGDLVDEKNANQYIERIKFYLNNPEKRENKSAADFKFVNENYDWRIIARRYEYLFKKILS